MYTSVSCNYMYNSSNIMLISSSAVLATSSGPYSALVDLTVVRFAAQREISPFIFSGLLPMAM